MAISQTITLPDKPGVIVQAAYGRIENIVMVDSVINDIHLVWYASQQTAWPGQQVREDHVGLGRGFLLADNPQFIADLDRNLTSGRARNPSDALHTSLYLLVKQQAEYVNAVDV